MVAVSFVSLGEEEGIGHAFFVFFLLLRKSLLKWSIWALIHYNPTSCFLSDPPSTPHIGFLLLLLLFLGSSPRMSSIFVAQWDCQHQALQYQCCFVLEVQLHRSGVCFLLNFWFWSHRPLWWGESMLLWLRSEPQQHFVYWLAEGIALAWLCSPLWNSF